MSNKSSTKETIREIIVKHQGRENAIFASQIAEEAGIDEGDTYSQTRKYLKQLLKEGIPLASNPGRGYWVIENQEELDNYIGSLERRARQTDNRKLYVLDAAEEWPDLDLTDDNYMEP